MTLNKNYIIQNRDLLIVLNKLQEFETTFHRFVMKHHPNKYTYELELNKEDEMWVCKIKLNEKSNNSEVSENSTRSSGVL